MLIEMYRSIHVNIENNFLVHYNSSQHSPADMTNMLQELCAKIRQHNCHHPVLGSRVNVEVMDALVEGVWSYTQVDVIEEAERGSELEALEVEDFDRL